MTTLSTAAAEFNPGSFWTPERAREAAAAMQRGLSSPEMQAALNGAADEAGEGHDSGEPQRPRQPTGEIDRANVTFRRGHIDDAPRLAELIAGADLPPLFIEEWISGFAVAVHGGNVIACGGLELYDDSGVIRSVVVDERARGLGLGRTTADLLIEDARLAGATDFYLMTADAWPFWTHLGFVDVGFDDWKDAPRASWQFVFLNAHREFFASFGGHTMWRRA